MTIDKTRTRLDLTGVRARLWDSVWAAGVPRNLRYPVKPAWWILARNVDRHANRAAIQVVDHTSGEPGVSVSYGELRVWARRQATGLQRLGVRRSDRVALYVPNSPALVASYFATWLLGATAVPRDSMAFELELARQKRPRAGSPRGNGSVCGIGARGPSGQHRCSPRGLRARCRASVLYRGLVGSRAGPIVLMEVRGRFTALTHEHFQDTL